MPVKINGTTSGSVTLAAPDTGSDVSLTLPTTALATESFVSNSYLPIAGGKILQVIGSSYGTDAASSSSTYADTGLTATITPSSASSKILVIVHQTGIRKETNNTYLLLRLLRNGTNIAQIEATAASTASTATNYVAGTGTTLLDSPATTSPVTYKTVFASANNNAAVSVQAGNSLSTITLMEVSA